MSYATEGRDTYAPPARPASVRAGNPASGALRRKFLSPQTLDGLARRAVSAQAWDNLPPSGPWEAILSEPLDAIDARILELLQEDASLSIADIAEKVGLSSSPAWRRIERLKK